MNLLLVKKFNERITRKYSISKQLDAAMIEKQTPNEFDPKVSLMVISLGEFSLGCYFKVSRRNLDLV